MSETCGYNTNGEVVAATAQCSLVWLIPYSKQLDTQLVETIKMLFTYSRWFCV